MNTELRAEQLVYFQRELAALRDEAAAFAQRFPNVAGALDLSGEASADPQVERLLEAFAFLAGRVQLRLDKQLPTLATALLDQLYPSLTAPVPSAMIAEVRVDPSRARAAHGHLLPRGTRLSAPTDLGASCQFRTVSDLELWPIEVVAADRPEPALLPFLDGRGAPGGLIRLRLRALGGEQFGAMAPARLRFRLAGAPATASALYEALLAQTREIWAIDPAVEGGAPTGLDDRAPDAGRRLAAATISPVGFAPEEALLPDRGFEHRGHRLLQEYFAFPEKFLFVDLAGLGPAPLATGGWLDLVFVLDRAAPPPAGADGPAIRLGHVPAVNLFTRVSEPIRVDRTATEYLVQPDARLERSTEVHSVRAVTLTRREENGATHAAPFFGFGHSDAMADPGVYWTVRRAPCRRPDMGGTDMLISFRDRAFDVAKPPAEVAFAHLLCTNRGVAEHLPPGARLGLEVDAPVASVRVAAGPTAQAAPPASGVDLWRLVAHLAANRLSFVDGPEASAALRTHLGLYGGGIAADRQVGGIAGLTTRRVARRIGDDAWRGFCRGIEVTLTLDEQRFVGGTGYLFATVLSHFFGLYAGATGFTELALRGVRRDEEWARWPPMAGARPVA